MSAMSTPAQRLVNHFQHASRFARRSLESSLSAAVSQWRLHASLFMNRYREEGVNGGDAQPAWSFHAFVFKQRSVMGLLTEVSVTITRELRWYLYDIMSPLPTPTFPNAANIISHAT